MKDPAAAAHEPPWSGVASERLIVRYHAMRQTVLVLMLVPAACAGLPGPRPAVAEAPVFSASRFFAGRTEGVGTLRIIARRAAPSLVVGRGRVADDGTLVLRQTVRQGNKPPTEREWRIHEVAPGRYAGTLTDAAGPLAGEVVGNRLRLSFRMKSGLTAEQQLYLAPDGASARNYMTIRKFGVVVASSTRPSASSADGARRRTAAAGEETGLFRLKRLEPQHPAKAIFERQKDPWNQPLRALPASPTSSRSRSSPRCAPASSTMR